MDQKSSQSSQDLSGPHQGGQYSSGRIMDFFSDRIVDFQFFIKFHRSGPAIIFIF